jgi:hypothetical protein
MDKINEILNIIALIYVILPLLFLLVLAVYYIAGKRLAPETWEKTADFGKWYIASIALVFIVKMLENSFTERETGIKEMQVYDKYAEIVLKANNIEERWKLSQYFSAVTPTPRLRDRWTEYRDTIRREYLIYTELKKVESQIAAKDSLTSLDRDTLAKVQIKLAPYEKRLIADDSAPGDWIVVFAADKNLEEAQYEIEQLNKAGVTDARIVFRNNFYRSVSREFSSKVEAQVYLNKYKNLRGTDKYIVQSSSWCANLVDNGSYYECR